MLDFVIRLFQRLDPLASLPTCQPWALEDRENNRNLFATVPEFREHRAIPRFLETNYRGCFRNECGRYDRCGLPALTST